MSAREWKPGDVAMVTADPWNMGETRTEIAFLVEGLWTFADGNQFHSSRTDLIRDVRPLVVIDPEDREQVERLGKDFHESAHIAPWHDLHQETRAQIVDALQAALREFADPKPRIEEPTGLGAVVRDAEGAVLVRTPGVVDRPAHWADMSGSFYTWADLDVAEILHEGWSE